MVRVTQGKNYWRTLLNLVLNLRVPYAMESVARDFSPSLFVVVVVVNFDLMSRFHL